jgi:hypothetical protein
MFMRVVALTVVYQLKSKSGVVNGPMIHGHVIPRDALIRIDCHRCLALSKP